MSKHTKTVVSFASCGEWENTSAFRTIQEKLTQRRYYEKMNASASIMRLVELDSKPFGSISEKIICEVLGIGPRTSTQNDGTFGGKKIEIKSARYWSGNDDCRWQHLEEHHDYDFALLVLWDFQEPIVWAITKPALMGLREKNIVSKQGEQGYWTTKNSILSYLTHIRCSEDLQSFVEQM
jgi:hypothetical protein